MFVAHRARAVIAVCALSICLVASVPPAHAGHGPDAAGGPYHGFASGSVIHVDALTTGTRVLDFEVGVANAQIDSEGVERVLNEYSRPLVPDAPGSAHAGAHSTIVEAGVALSPPDAMNQVRPHIATALAPSATTEETKVVLNQAIGSVAYVDLLRNEAEARWNGSTCVLGAPLAGAEQHAARLHVVESGDDESTEPSEGFDRPVVAVDSDGPTNAVTRAISRQFLYKGEGPGFGLYSVSAATIAPVTFLEGTPNEFGIELAGPATLVAMADGTTGGAKVVSRVPALTLKQGGEERTLVPSSPITIRAPETGDAIAEIKVGTTEALASPKGLGSALTSPNGTRAAAQANVVEVKILHTATAKAATFAIGHLEAGVTVPAGGISCPIPVDKVASPPSVRTGASFTTTITVRNPFSCPLRNVSLVDLIDVEGGALFQITGTSPAASSFTGGANRSEGSARWMLGDIPAGGSKSVTITMVAQGTAGRILDTATATGTLANCPVSPDTDGADVTGLAAATAAVSGAASLVVPETRVLGVAIDRDLPRTGVAPLAGAVPMLVLAAGGALVAFRRRR